MKEVYKRLPHRIVGKQSNGKTSFVSGTDNPIGLHCKCYVLDNGDVAAKFTLTRWHEGHEGVGHGGSCYAVLDEMMGRAVNDYNEGHRLGGISVFSGEITCRYVSPAPVGEELYAYARVISEEGRKRFVTAEVLRADGTVVIRTKGTYLVAPDYHDDIRLAYPVELTSDDPEIFY